MPDQQPFDEQADKSNQHEHQRHAREEVQTHGTLQKPDGVGAEHHELAMRQINHTHGTVDYRQTEGDEQQDRGDAEADRDLRDN